MGNATRTTTYPAIAGLKMLYPRPPKSCLATPTANIDAVAVTHQGVRAGSAKVINAAVTRALRSLSTVSGFRPRRRTTKASVPTQNNAAISKFRTKPKPKYQT